MALVLSSVNHKKNGVSGKPNGTPPRLSPAGTFLREKGTLKLVS